jgi:hypothetical protein
MAMVYRSEKGYALTHAEHDNNFRELDEIPNGKTFPSARDKGIKLDKSAPDFGWHDMVGQLKVYGTGSEASIQTYRGNIKVLQFEEGQEAFVDYHLPHDYAMGTDFYVHAHWSHISDKVVSGSCTFGFEIMYAKGHDQGYFDDPITITVTQEQNGQYRHMIAETIASDGHGGSGTTLDRDIIEVDGIIQLRIFLDSNDLVTSDGSTVHPFIHFVDFHYQSTGLATKNKAPDFWS